LITHSRRRIGTIWLGILVFVAGNVADAADWIRWGPGQSDGNRLWVLASAGLFWLAVSTAVVLLYDVVATALDPDRRPPGSTELIGPRPLRQAAEWIRRRAADHTAVIGAGGLIAGAIIGHLVWKP